MIYDDRTTGKKVRIFLDLVSFGRGRTEILMSTTGPLIGAAACSTPRSRLGADPRRARPPAAPNRECLRLADAAGQGEVHVLLDQVVLGDLLDAALA